jgi:ATP-dependent NAD(P)H-hydrate dehydratase
MNMPLILDADALFIVQKDRRVIDGYPNIVLTPNLNEFQRLRSSVGIRDEQDRELACRLLSKAYGGVTVVQKGEVDIIACGDKGTYS